MKKITLLWCCFLFTTIALKSYAQIGIGTTTPDITAALEIKSTTKGFLMPRMSIVQVGTIISPAEGLMVYDTTTKNVLVFKNNTWTILGNNSDVKFTDGTNSDDAVYNQGNVGIGTVAPGVKLDVNGYIKVGSSDVNGDGNPQSGMLRFNSTTSKFQVYANGAWADLH